ncbi:helix-turn-helix domain-containing protein [Thiomicrorhabdus sp. zzn3]|uniref:helix-turn-helix domain-containing protein n=1 Tax=Thiomicrorhabdus sp. zzn3 TaxID=3039775 RepID=UPI0024363E96|nr:helix-turn-helix domain-containing protein [Thiomicrorhabdus sp. zzn3]MDG6778446.1 helix-turn-helix domain-containing protein [Thiomicrorhabdus sp. zzn3]
MTEQPNAETPLNQLLSDARKSQKLTIKEAAKKLNLSEAQLQQFEQASCDLATMGPFERGYLRNYAQLLDVDEAVVESYLDAVSSAGSELKSMQRFQYPAPKPLIRGSFGRFVVWVLLIVLGGALVWFLLDYLA